MKPQQQKNIISLPGSKAYLCFWPGQFMYIGQAADTSIHDHHAIQLIISFDEPIEIELPGSLLKVNAAIIDSDQPHQCKTFNNRFLLMNIAPESDIGITLRNHFLSDQNIRELPASRTSEFIEEVSEALAEGADKDPIYTITQKFLHSLSDTPELISMDDRIIKVIKLLNQPHEETISIKGLSDQVFLSPSRLIHLFTKQVGIPIRKYILWLKLLTALQKAIETENMTEAALHGGFSDAPHFNRTFKRMFGLNPTSLLKNSRIVQANRE